MGFSVGKVRRGRQDGSGMVFCDRKGFLRMEFVVSEVVRSIEPPQVSDGFRFHVPVEEGVLRSWFSVYDSQENSCIYNKSSSSLNLAKSGVHQAIDFSQPLTCVMPEVEWLDCPILKVI